MMQTFTVEGPGGLEIPVTHNAANFKIEMQGKVIHLDKRKSEIDGWQFYDVTVDGHRLASHIARQPQDNLWIAMACNEIFYSTAPTPYGAAIKHLFQNDTHFNDYWKGNLC